MVEADAVRRSLFRRLFPRVIKATLWGTMTFFVYYLPYQLFIMPMLMFPGAADLISGTLFYAFIGIVVFFAVVIKLCSDTIFQHVFSIARALILMIYFIYAFRGGIIALAPSVGDVTFNIMLDLRVFLYMVLLINLLGLGKSLLHAIDFLAREREPLPI